MKDLPPKSEINPYAPPQSEASGDNGSQRSPSTRWFHWLVFYSPSVLMIALFMASRGRGYEWGLSNGLPGELLSVALCFANSLWLPRRTGLGGFFFGLIVNIVTAVGVCALVASAGL